MVDSFTRTSSIVHRRPHILVCAPSNGAVDNILRRVVRNGFYQLNGSQYQPALVRVGVSDLGDFGSHSEFSAEFKADSLLAMPTEDWIAWLSRQYHTVRAIESELAQDLEQFIALQSTGVMHQSDSLKSKMLHLYEHRDRAVGDLSRLESLRRYHENTSTSHHDMDRVRIALEISFVDEAEIVFTTLASSGRKTIKNVTHGFSNVIVDEAAQSTELSTILPLLTGAKHCILVGDSQQLPSTVLSKVAKEVCYDRSLFERLIENGVPSHMLTIQYRMHPHIRQFPSTFFYGGALTDAASCAKERYKLDFVALSRNNADVTFSPYLVFDTHAGNEERNLNGSIRNNYEATLCMNLLQLVSHSTERNDSQLSVAVISPYTSHCSLLSELARSLSPRNFELTISTIDGFQGRESDVVIFSCVRNSQNGLGFLSDARRLNVALTRAKSALWVLCSRINSTNAIWNALLQDAESRKLLVTEAAVEKLNYSMSQQATNDDHAARNTREICDPVLVRNR